MKLRTILLILTLLALITASAGGYLYYASLEKSVSEREHLKGDALVSNIASHLDMHIVERQRLLRVIAGEEEFEQAFINRNERTLANADAILDRLSGSMDIENVFYLLDGNGNTITASNRNTPDSFIGKNYSFRPYFHEAMKGKPSLYMAIGVTSNKKGIYYSHPVHGKDKQAPAGVLVLKESIEEIQNKLDLERYSSDGILLLTDPRSVVFLSSRGDWISHFLWEMSPEALGEIASSRQFGKGPWKWTGMKRIDAYYTIDPSGRKYHIHSREINNYPGWKITFLHDHSAVAAKTIPIVLRGGGYVILPLFTVILLSFFMLYRLADNEIIRRKASEEKAINTARECDRTFNSISDLVSVHSRDFKIIRANKALSDFLGMKNEDIIGKHCYELLHGTECPVLDCPHVKAIESNTPVTNEIHDQKTGSYLMVTASPITNKQNEVIGSVHIVKNITAMKKLQEQLVHAQKMEAVGQLAGGVAHEFNNILAAIINYNYIMRDMAPGDPDYLKRIDAITSLAERASHLSRSLLAFSRNQFLELKPLNINSILKNANQFLRAFIGKNIELVSHADENDLVLMGSEINIEQCIMVLASNARDAMPDGGTLTIKTETVEINTHFIRSHGFGIPGAFALMSVTDTGTGMDEKTIEKIFEPFFTTKEVGKGTGLGLSMVFGIMKQHEGYIEVNSTPGHGTTFNLYFPLLNKDKLLSKTREAL